jgi:hypothetical protein
MMKDCLGLLEADEGTRLIMIVAKTAKEKVIREVMDHVKRKTTKPIVACFLGLDPPAAKETRVTYAKTLHAAVYRAAQVSGREAASEFDSTISMSFEDLSRAAKALSASLGRGRKYLRGLYSGGTLAHETLLIFKELLGEAYSNTPLTERFTLSDPNVSKENSVVDMGDEFFTAGRAHPIIDPTLRRLRLSQEARDSNVAAIVLDIVLGYGSSSDPGGALQAAIREAIHASGRKGGGLAVMAHVCGTETDPQSLREQSGKLSSVGTLLFGSNALLAAGAALVVGGDLASARLRQKWGELLG